MLDIVIHYSYLWNLSLYRTHHAQLPRIAINDTHRIDCCVLTVCITK
jgi:hypothetical protein